MSHSHGKAVSLTVIEQDRNDYRDDRRRKARLQPWLLRLYRLGIILAIVLIVHRQHARLAVDGDAPIKLDEVKPFYAEAARLETDESPRKGLCVLDERGNQLGYVVRTSPVADKITYVGFWNGQMLAQSLLGGWAASGVAWRIAPALTLLLAAALIVPWSSRRALYRSQISPHGVLQIRLSHGGGAGVRAFARQGRPLRAARRRRRGFRPNDGSPVRNLRRRP